MYELYISIMNDTCATKRVWLLPSRTLPPVGWLPPELGALGALESMDLSQNNLEGEVSPVYTWNVEFHRVHTITRVDCHVSRVLLVKCQTSDCNCHNRVA